MPEFPVHRSPKFLQRLEWGHYAIPRQHRLPSRWPWPTRPDAAYYRALFERANRFALDLPEAAWFDLWHTHFDWDDLPASATCIDDAISSRHFACFNAPPRS
ncbi:MAG: hypothetical protein JNL19_16630 [Burkholderiales bacterium]|nr:hypothetical protein [Burkholderiales bacterium]